MTKTQMKIVIAVIVAMLLVSVGVGVARWYYVGKLVDKQRELNNVEARADTLKVVAVARGDSLKVAEIRILTAENRAGVERAVSDELRRAAEEFDGRLTTALDLALAYRNQIVTITTAQAVGDSTVLPIDYVDGALEVTGDARFRGTIAPDPEPPVSWNLAVLLRELSVTAALFEDEDCAPHILLETTDPHVEALSVGGVVDQRRTCLEDRRVGFPISFGINFGTGILTGAGITAIVLTLVGVGK